MKKCLRFFLCVAIVTLQPIFSKASHIVGGEMTYECLGNNEYLITLKVYRDCFNGAAGYDDPTNVFVFDGNGNIVATLPIPFPGSDTLPNNTGNPCLVVPPGICVEEAIFQYNVFLDPSPGGYSMVYQRCCRNYSIDNIASPDNTGASYLGHIPDPDLAECNSSPYFKNFPPPIICLTEPLIFDHSAIDPDGDSLVYMICDPYIGGSSLNPIPNPALPPPYSFVTFVLPYSSSNPMGGSPSLAINSATGELTVTPTTTGQFVVGICVSEYRNGQFLDEHKRDFQFNVAQCIGPQASIDGEANTVDNPAVFNTCQTYTFNFPNNSSNATSYFWDFGVLTSSTDTSSAINPTFTFPDTGLYHIILYVNPGSTCADTAYGDVYVYPFFTAAISAPDGCVGQPVQFSDNSTTTFTTVSDWLWSFGTGDTSNLQNPAYVFDEVGTYTVTLIASNEAGCTDTISDVIIIFPSPTINAIPDDTIICKLDQIQLNAAATGANNFNWEPNYNLSNPNISNPLAGPDVTVTYTVSISNSYGCVAMDSVHVEVYDTVIAHAGSDTTICPGGSVQLNGSGGINFLWAPPTGLSSTSVYNPIASPASTTSYIFSTSVGSCAAKDTVIVYVKPFPTIVAGPDVSICQYQSVQISASGGTSYSWSPSGTLDNAALESPTATPLVTTTYTVSGTNANACPFVGQDSLTVSIIPIPPIFITEDTTIILGTYTVLSVTGGASYVWVPSTGLDDPTSPTPVASPTETTTYVVYITTADGCPTTDSVTITIVLDPLVEFPTAFSPNGDDKNNYFRPLILGLAHLDEFRIFNRWGQEVFAISNVNVIGGPLPENLSWDGTYKGEVQPVGVYVYYLKGVASATGLTIAKQGNLTLVR
ncbi:MAG: gliding motility-associated C-terminal domain-containing protein [Chitinophagaceae bacterium]|nr:gliding motility-associated C-terminal domain-containing protein [Chitinophagaceae bacterium]